MMNKTAIYLIILMISFLISACAQIMLKKAAGKQYNNRLAEYMNVQVIVGYALFMSCIGISVIVLRYIPLSLAAMLEPSAYVFVTILSYLILKEKISRRGLAGILLIIVGTILSVL